MKFRGPPGKCVRSEQPGSTSDCDAQERAAEETRRRGKEASVTRDPRSLEKNVCEEARSRSAATPCSRAQLAEDILALEECRSLVTLIKAASVA